MQVSIKLPVNCEGPVTVHLVPHEDGSSAHQFWFEDEVNSFGTVPKEWLDLISFHCSQIVTWNEEVGYYEVRDKETN